MLEPSTFTEKQAARILGVSSKTLFRWRKAGAIGFHRTPGVRGRITYSMDQIANFRSRCRVDVL